MSKESPCTAGDLGFDPWVGKIPWRRERLCTPVFLPGEVHGLYSPWGHKELMERETEVDGVGCKSATGKERREENFTKPNQ